jgi:hypothetical protein
MQSIERGQPQFSDEGRTKCGVFCGRQGVKGSQASAVRVNQKVADPSSSSFFLANRLSGIDYYSAYT